MGFPGSSDGKESACNAGNLGFPREGHGDPLQYFCLENPHGQKRLASYSLWGRKDSDMTEQLSTAHKKLLIQKDICTTVFTGTLFTVAETWEQVSKNKQVDKNCGMYICT